MKNRLHAISTKLRTLFMCICVFFTAALPFNTISVMAENGTAVLDEEYGKIYYSIADEDGDGTSETLIVYTQTTTIDKETAMEEEGEYYEEGDEYSWNDFKLNWRKCWDWARPQITNVRFEEGSNWIFWGMFNENTSLKSITLPDTIQVISSLTFQNCTSLKNIVIPEGVKTINYGTFWGDSSLESVTIPESVVNLSTSRMFDDCTSLTEVNLPESVTAIEGYAFDNCSKLKNIDLPSHVTSIGNRAFYQSGLTSIILPETLTEIDDEAFSACDSLTSVTIPDAVTTIGNHAFGYDVNDNPVAFTMYASCNNQAAADYAAANPNVTLVTTHSFTNRASSEKVSDATCSAQATYKAQCDYCDEISDTDTVADGEFLPHTLIKTEAKEATHTEAGNNAYWTCSECGKVFADEAGQIETTVEAQTIAAKGHSMIKTEAKAATCTEDGNNEYWTCSECGKVFTDAAGQNETTVAAQTIAAKGHSMTKTEAKAATCTENGNNEYWTCDECGKVFADEAGQNETTVAAQTITANGHNMTKTEAKNATCTEAGNNEYWTCDECGKVFADEAGLIETTVEAQTIEAAGHSLIKTEAKAATCTEDGNNAYWTCDECGKVFADEAGQIETTVEAQTIEAAGHSLTKTEAKAATCTESGNNAYWTCDECGKVFADEAGLIEATVEAQTIEAAGHSLTKTEAKSATCTEAGNNEYWTCDECGKVFADEAGLIETTVEAQTIAANGHSMTKTEAKSATCTESGNNAYWICDECGKVFTDAEGQNETTAEAQTIEAEGHTCFSILGIFGYCTHCHSWVMIIGNEESVHIWDLGHVTKRATDTEPGIMTYTCYGCGETRTEEIPVHEHCDNTFCGHTFSAE